MGTDVRAAHETIIAGGRVVDPANGVDAVRDVAIAGGRIAAVAERIAPGPATRVVDAAGRIVTPGLVDLHAHCYWGRDYFGIDPDSLAWRSGVTTWVDAGSAGAFSLPGLREHVERRSAVRVLGFANISYLGVPGLNYDDYCNPRACDVPLLTRVIAANRDFVVGVKTRMGKGTFCSPDLGPLRKAVEAAAAAGLPVMCHISDAPPGVASVLRLLRAGDIVTHAYTDAGQKLVDDAGRLLPAARRARQRGVRFDVGHGAGSFSFPTAEALVGQGFWPDTISTDLHQLSLVGPNLLEDQEVMPRVRADATPSLTLPLVMTKFLSLGMPLAEVVRATTTAPAAAIGRPDLGTLAPGAPADVAVLRLDREPVELVDIAGNRRVADRQLRAERTFFAGRELDPRPLPPPPPWFVMVDDAGRPA